MDYKKKAKQLIELFFGSQDDGVGEKALIEAFQQIAQDSREKALVEAAVFAERLYTPKPGYGMCCAKVTHEIASGIRSLP